MACNGFPRYIEIIDAGEMNCRATMTIAKELPGAVLIDADRAPGQVAMSFAAAEATRKAKEGGIGLALVRRTTHTAALGYYTRLAALQGMAALAGSASWPNMVYHGTREAGVATNPFSIAVPRGAGEPLVLDMATGVVALGKIVHAARSGRPIPEGWALDRDGNPTTDPKEGGLPLALGRPQRRGTFADDRVHREPHHREPAHRRDARRNRGRQEASPERLPHRDRYRRLRPARAVRRKRRRAPSPISRRLPRQAGVDEILMPGERGDREAAKRRETGITIPAATWKDIGGVAARFGVTLP